MPQNFIFIGRSGCGKGTQAELLKSFLEKNTESPIFYLGSGQKFREFVSRGNYTSNLAGEIARAGGLQPEFLSVWVWANAFIENLTENNHLIVDGTPRKIREAQLLDSAFQFYGRTNPHVLYVDISREEAAKRLRLRGRDDDKEEKDIQERMDWFDTEVMQVVNYFKENKTYNFHHINGERGVEEIHEDIIQKISNVAN